MERLNPLSATFLEAEEVDHAASLAIGSLAIFEGPVPDFGDFVRTIEGRLPLIPRYRQKLRSVAFGLTPPAWVDDPDFDIENHVSRIALPAPGGRHEIDQLMSAEMARRIDRTRPLWEYSLCEGLPDGQWAILSKVHHSMVDGVSGTDLYRLILDPSATPRPSVADWWVPEERTGALAFTGAAAREIVLSPMHLARGGARGLRHPRSLVDTAVRSARGAIALMGALLPVSKSSLTGPTDGTRRYCWTECSLSEVRAVRAAFGVTVNDVALAAVAGGFRALLLSRGETPDAHTLRSLVPVSTRPPGTESVMDNRVSLLLPYLPVDLADPGERLAAVHQRVRALHDHHEHEAGERLTTAAELLPFPPLSFGIKLALRLPQHQVATVTTNVPGPRQPLYCMGREATRLLPYVPIADQVRIGIAMFSYCDTLTFGITADRATTPDLDVLTDGIATSVAELVLAAR